MSAIARRISLRGRIPSLGLTSGIVAIIVKELRGRMRGRRAFIIVTLYVLLLAVFGWMLQQITEAQVANRSSYGIDSTYASAQVGRGIFVGLLLAQTLMVAVLAPAATASAISGEREHQTLDLLAVTPISSLAIVMGKLLSALAWVFVLVVASIPVTALVFVFGGVAPDDVVRGYAVLFATVIGLGSVGLFFSALTRRTGASTGLTFVATIALTIGSYYVFGFMSSTAEFGPTGLRKPAPEAILYLNPFVAQVDVACGTEDGGFGNACTFMSAVLAPTDQFLPPPGIKPVEPIPGIRDGVEPDFPVNVEGGVIGFDRRGGVVIGGGEAEQAVGIGLVADSFRDRFWPKTVISFLLLAVILTIASIQFVTPTRRWRPSLPGPVRRLVRRRSAP
jgi:ABC-type transport system involved in multi-copper enzyme maturation permease subunit